MILLQSFIEGTSYQIRPLNSQSFEKDLTRKIEDLKVTCSIAEFAKFPLGTIFFSKTIEKPEADHIHIPTGAAYPLLMGENVYPLVGISEEDLKSMVDYVVDYMIAKNDDTFNMDTAKKFAEAVAGYGYIVDFDKKMEIPAAGAASSGSMRVSIAAKYPVPRVEDIGFQVDPDQWYLMVRNVLRGENTLLIGPTGCGKTEIMKHLANAMERELHIQDMGTVQDAQSALLGVHTLNKDGVSEFKHAPFVSHIQSGGIVLLDELSRAPLAANNILFPCLDNRRYLPVDVAHDEKDQKIMVNDATVFIATANIGNEYSGTNALDRALLDRFFPIETQYPQENDEIKVLITRTGIEENEAKAIVKVANEVRKQYRDQELSSSISVRHTLQTAGLVVDGFDLTNALQAVVMPLFDDGIGASERAKVKSIIAAF